jgi:hypothetical protein
MKRILLFALFLLPILTGACATAPTTQSSVYPAPATSNPGSLPPYPAVTYPSPNAAYPSPPGEPELMATPGTVPTPAADSGIIKGALLVKGKPVANVSLYLAELLQDDKGNDTVASYDRASSPRAYTDMEGKFVFANIPPGKYSLIYDFVVNALLLGHPDGKGPMIFPVEAGKVENLGDLDYPELPLITPTN